MLTGQVLQEGTEDLVNVYADDFCLFVCFLLCFVPIHAFLKNF